MSSTRKSAPRRPARERTRAFSLIELLVVMGIVAMLSVLVVPAVIGLKSAGDVTNAAYTVSDVLQQARSYALANNTYAWVGFFEEDASQPSMTPARVGIGRIVLSVVASKDGTQIYPGSLSSGSGAIDPRRLTQVGKLIRIDNMHLASFDDGTGRGTTFDARPPVRLSTARIGDDTPPDPSLSPFQYPVGNPAPTAQYTFTKAVQFGPRGEARINNNNFSLKPVAEVGLRPARGATVDMNTPNVAAIQFTGIAGNISIFRR